MTSAAMGWVGTVIGGGRYEITAKVGEGGMGYVYRAWDSNLGTDVIIKVPRRAMVEDPEFAERFGREIRSLVRLSHPHIVKVIDVGGNEGIPFAVMQYLSGGSLENRRTTGPDGRVLPMEPRSIREWLPSVAAALDFIHGQGYVHRDVKPANILFDAHGNAYLSDFGIAKALAAGAQSTRVASLTGTGMVLGTPHYMAPELILGQKIDGRIDQYALAVTVHELLCGRPPIDGPTPAAVLVQQATQTPTALRDLAPHFDGPLTEAVLKALAKSPEQRFASCIQFSDAVTQAIAPMAAGPPIMDFDSQTQPPLASRGHPGRVPCPQCHAVLPLKSQHAGKRARCQRCGSLLVISDDLCEVTLAKPEVASTTKRTTLPTVGSSVPSQDKKPVADKPKTSFDWRIHALLSALGIAAVGLGLFWATPSKDIASPRAGAENSMPRTNPSPQLVRSADQPPPLRSIPDQRIRPGDTLRLVVEIIDSSVALKSIEFGLAGVVPAGAKIDPRSGCFEWAPTEAQIGTHLITVRVTREGTTKSSTNRSFSVTVERENRPPTLATQLKDASIAAGKTLRFRAEGADPDLPDDKLNFTLRSGYPKGASIGRDTGEFSWTPNEIQVGTHTLTVQVSDRKGAIALNEFNVFVTDGKVRLEGAPIADWVGHASIEQDPQQRAEIRKRFATAASSQTEPVATELVRFLGHWSRLELITEKAGRNQSADRVPNRSKGGGASTQGRASSDPLARDALEAAELLKCLGKPTYPVVLTALKNSKSPPTRAGAAFVLGDEAFTDAQANLQPLTRDVDASVRYEVVLSLLATAARQQDISNETWKAVREFYEVGACPALLQEPLTKAVAGVGSPVVPLLLEILPASTQGQTPPAPAPQSKSQKPEGKPAPRSKSRKPNRKPTSQSQQPERKPTSQSRQASSSQITSGDISRPLVIETLKNMAGDGMMALADALGHKDREVVKAAAAALAEIKPSEYDAPLADKLVKVLGQCDWRNWPDGERRKAIKSLSELKRTAVPAFCELLRRRSDVTLRLIVAAQLGGMQDAEDAVPGLIGMLADSQCRLTAARALGHIGPRKDKQRALEALQELLKEKDLSLTESNAVRDAIAAIQPSTS